MSSHEESCYRVTHYGHARNQLVINQTHWRMQTTGIGIVSAAQELEMLTLLEAKYAGNIVPLLHTDYVYDKTRLQALLYQIQVPDPKDPTKTIREWVIGTDQEISTAAGAAGSHAGDSLPLTTAMVVNWLTGEHGRRKRGRMKMSPMAKTDSLSDKVGAGVGAPWGAALAIYNANMNLGAIPVRTVEQCILSTADATDNVPLTKARSFTAPVINFKLSVILGVQRSRKLRENYL